MLNIPNLTKLAEYVEQLPDDYDHFDMLVYFEKYDMLEAKVYQKELEYALGQAPLNECGTVACLLGTGPAAGLPMSKEHAPDGHPDWLSYGEDTFFVDWDDRNRDYENAWDWLFSSRWFPLDNTAKGAAMRIRLLIQHGVDMLPVNESGYFVVNAEALALYKG